MDSLWFQLLPLKQTSLQHLIYANIEYPTTFLLDSIESYL